jgi:hypothetical protein
MSTIQLILLGLGVVIALGAYGSTIAKFALSKFSKTSPTVNVPAPIDFPSKIEFPSVPTRVATSTEFADIVIQWEKLADMLIEADMKDSAKELKDLLVNMAQEYKTDTPVAAPVKKETTNLFAIQSLMS